MRFLIVALASLWLLTCVTPAFAQDMPVSGEPATQVPTTDAEAGELIGALLDTAANGHWTVFTGMLLLLLVWLMNRMGLAAKVGRDWVPWVTLGTGTVVAVAAGLVSGEPVLDAIKLGVLEGGIAIALWELVFKRMTQAKTDGSPRSSSA